MTDMKVYSHEEMLDHVLGAKGSPTRDKYEADMNNFLIGEAIKQAREAKNLTQEQLGELMGVKRAQISKIESGKSIRNKKQGRQPEKQYCQKFIYFHCCPLV